MQEPFAYEFPGKEISRDDFKSDFSEKLHKFLGEKDETFVVLCTEIAKNIYDHADGKGHAVFYRISGQIKFHIWDYGTEQFDFEKVKAAGSTKVGNGINFGIGLRTIEDAPQKLPIKIHIDTSAGFAYSGTYRPQTHTH